MSRLTCISRSLVAMLFAFAGLLAVPGLVPCGEASPQRSLRLESIRIVGNERASDELIRSYLRLDPGDAVDVDILETARLRLVATDYFSDVEFSTRRGSARGSVVLIVDVVERGISFETGFGYHDLHGWFLTLLGVRFDNMAGSDSQLRVGWRLGFHLSGIDARWDKRLTPGGAVSVGVGVHAYQQEHLFFSTRPLTPNVTNASDWRQFRQDIDRVGGEVALRYRLARDTYLSAGIKANRIEPDSSFATGRNEDDDVSFPFADLPAVLQGSAGERSIAGVFLRVVRDTRDDVAYPRSGSRALLTFESNNSLLGSDEIFVKGTVDVRKHIPLARRSALSTRLAAGIAENAAPYYERFYVGGSYSIRGFEEWSLSPTEGDDGYWMISEELRFPMTISGTGQPRVTGLVFFDAGQGWRWDDSTAGDDIESAAGYGIRIRLPWLGTLGFDAGIPLSTGRTGDRFRVHGSLGFSF